MGISGLLLLSFSLVMQCTLKHDIRFGDKRSKYMIKYNCHEGYSHEK